MITYHETDFYPQIPNQGRPDSRAARKDTPPVLKAALVDLGIVALSRSEQLIVAAITNLIRARGLVDE